MGFDLGSIVGKVVEYTAPPGTRFIADAVGIDIGDSAERAVETGVKAGKAYVESPLHPYGQAKAAARLVSENPEAMERAGHASVVGAAWALAPGLMAAKGAMGAVAEHPKEAKRAATTAGWIVAPGVMAAREAAEQVAKHPREALALHDRVASYMPGGAIATDVRRFLLGF